MNRRDVPPSPPRLCAYAWCVTEHGRTVHPHDEDHRSAGIAVAVRVRPARDRGAGRSEQWELGLLRRTTDSETWFVVEAEEGTSVALSREALGMLLEAVRADRDLSAFYGDGEPDS